MLPKEIVTTKDRNLLLGRIDQLLPRLHKPSPSGELADLVDILGIDIDPQVNIDSVQSVEQWLKTLRDQLLNTPEIELTIAFPARRTFVNNLRNWADTAVPGTDVLFDVRVQTDLLAGAQIGFRGKMIDKSLSNKIDHYEWV